MRIVAIAVLIVTVLISFGCEEVVPEYSAQLITVEELNASPGYPWFPTEVDVYDPVDSLVNVVRSQFDPTTQRIVLFVKPAGVCRGTTKLFPQVMKTLFDAGVDLSRVEVYSMRSATDKHPFQPTIQIGDLPVVYVFRNDTVSAIIRTYDYSSLNADVLTADAVQR